MNTTTPSTSTGLWRHLNFLKLWAGSTVSLFGSQITFLAFLWTFFSPVRKLRLQTDEQAQ